MALILKRSLLVQKVLVPLSICTPSALKLTCYISLSPMERNHLLENQGINLLYSFESIVNMHQIFHLCVTLQLIISLFNSMRCMMVTSKQCLTLTLTSYPEIGKKCSLLIIVLIIHIFYSSLCPSD